MNNNINNLFKAIVPTEDVKEKMFHEILKQSKIMVNDENPKQSKHFHIKKRFMRPIVACGVCLMIVLGLIPFMGNSTEIMIYAYETDSKIASEGVDLSTGSISDDGEMRGQLLQMYVKGKNIESIKYFCKNQYMDFTDWTETRKSYSMSKNFTINYGENTSDYNYLVIYWNPNDTIRKLTDNNIGISNLSDELRNDIIVMEVNFKNGSTVTKAINIKLQDNGKIIASMNAYTISDKNDFILSPEPLIKKTSPQPVVKKDDNIKKSNYSAKEINIAQQAAEAYYNDKTKFTLISIERDTSSEFLKEKYEGYYSNNIVAFKVHVID
ncbi:hypothetical protein [Clostridium sp.]|uniref:hypothetical protein n=1 Tax=Clostridium sp. TaxID=1506 RepID=UPI003D6CDF3C